MGAGQEKDGGFKKFGEKICFFRQNFSVNNHRGHGVANNNMVFMSGLGLSPIGWVVIKKIRVTNDFKKGYNHGHRYKKLAKLTKTKSG